MIGKIERREKSSEGNIIYRGGKYLGGGILLWEGRNNFRGNTWNRRNLCSDKILCRRNNLQGGIPKYCTRKNIWNKIYSARETLCSENNVWEERILR